MPVGAARVRVGAGESAALDAQLARELATKLEDKRRAIRNLEEPWQRNLADLRAKLTELKVTYAPAHPLVIEQERRIDDANVVPPALAALRFEEKALLAQADAIPESVTRALKPFLRGGIPALLQAQLATTLAGEPTNLEPMKLALGLLWARSGSQT